MQNLVESKTSGSTTPDDSGTSWFAINISILEEDEIENRFPGSYFVDPFPGTMTLSKKDAAIFAQARSLLAWQDRYGFCATCGTASTLEEAGYKLTCTNKDCRSQKGKNLPSKNYYSDQHLGPFYISCFLTNPNIIETAMY